MLVQSSNQTESTHGRPAEVVVSNLALNSRFFLQNANTNKFFQGIERWTYDFERALVFYDVQEALYICRWLGLTDVRIISNAEDSDRVDALQAVA